MLQVLARSATGERMNPYTSLWSGVVPGDGPQRFHVVLLDNGRSRILARKVERQTLQCIRCAACLNTCPVYRQTGGHAYGSPYAGPIGAILTPQLEQMQHAQSLPYASSLCGACYEVCPVKINIPEVLIELRAQVVDQERSQPARWFDPMYLGMKAANIAFANAWRFSFAQRLGRIGLRFFTGSDGWIHRLPSPRGPLDPVARSPRAPRANLSRMVGSARSPPKSRRANDPIFSASGNPRSHSRRHATPTRMPTPTYRATTPIAARSIRQPASA